MTGLEPGRYELDDVRVSFRLNDGSVQSKHGITVGVFLCVTDPPPESPFDCPADVTE